MTSPLRSSSASGRGSGAVQPWGSARNTCTPSASICAARPSGPPSSSSFSSVRPGPTCTPIGWLTTFTTLVRLRFHVYPYRLRHIIVLHVTGFPISRGRPLEEVVQKMASGRIRRTARRGVAAAVLAWVGVATASVLMAPSAAAASSATVEIKNVTPPAASVDKGGTVTFVNKIPAQNKGGISIPLVGSVSATVYTDVAVTFFGQKRALQPNQSTAWTFNDPATTGSITYTYRIVPQAGLAANVANQVVNTVAGQLPKLPAPPPYVLPTIAPHLPAPPPLARPTDPPRPPDPALGDPAAVADRGPAAGAPVGHPASADADDPGSAGHPAVALRPDTGVDAAERAGPPVSVRHGTVSAAESGRARRCRGLRPVPLRVGGQCPRRGLGQRRFRWLGWSARYLRRRRRPGFRPARWARHGGTGTERRHRGRRLPVRRPGPARGGAGRRRRARHGDRRPGAHAP